MMMNCSRVAETYAPVLMSTYTQTYRKTVAAGEEGRETSCTDLEKIVLGNKEKERGKKGKEVWRQ